MRTVLLISVVWMTGTAVTCAEEKPPPGDAVLREYIKQEALKLDGAFLAGVKDPADWRGRRAEYRRKLLDMFGLQPLPKRTDLKATITGTLERKDFVIEKLHFQSRRHLYVTGNLYRPGKARGRLPAVLYVCGHAGRGRDGNKTAYQHHGIWFATHGYVCLVIDSLQLGEIAAIHHGTYRYDRWWWHSRGYTPAGVECWNCIRALDYLAGRDDVDAKRMAVTGRSGGGAYSFWLAAADDRVKAAVPVSGMSDLEDYVKPPVVNGHCDCMFLYNTYQWPWTRIAALAAPRGLLFANSDRDRIFPMPGNKRVIARLRKLYTLLGHADRVDAFVTPGGHRDTPPLRNAAFTWINRFLKDDPRPVVEPKTYPKIPAKDLRAFPDRLPEDEINTKIDRTFVPRAKVAPPGSAQALQSLRRRLLAALRKTTFSAFPAAYPKQKVTLAGSAVSGTYATEPPIVTGYRYVPGPKASRTCWLVVLARGQSDERVPKWAGEIIGRDACVLLSPRGVGPTERTIKKPFYFRRAMALLGRTMDSGRLWDVMAFIHAADRPRTTWKVLGRGPAGVIGAYAALFEPKIKEVVCVQPPASHDNGPYFLGVMRTLDVPDALGLLAPRSLRVIGTKAKAFDKTAAYYKAAGAQQQFTR